MCACMCISIHVQCVFTLALTSIVFFDQVMLPNELSPCYATIALVTDYDSWRDVETHDHVSDERDVNS